MNASSATILKYRNAAPSWERDALPIGNGRLGAMLLGSAERTEIQFNVSSLWTGNENPSGDYDAQGFGQYQAFGSVFLEIGQLGDVRDHVRELDLASAMHSSRFEGADGTKYTLEAFASHPHEVIVLRVRATGPRMLEGTLRLRGAHQETTRSHAAETGSARLMFAGALPNALAYRAELVVTAQGGEVVAESEKLVFSNVHELTLYLAADTDYAPDPSTGWRGPSPDSKISGWLSRAQRLGFQALRQAHVDDHARLFGRVSVDFGASPESARARPTDVRVQRYEPGRDPELIATLFHYGRYLLIASSRRNGLPANLQGLWNHVNDPPWHSDYHTNINIQMNYWLAEPANLAECHEPLFTLLDAMLPATRAATRATFGDDVPGFTYRTSHNIFGGQGWEWNTPASAWYAMHYFEHFAFSRNLTFLREQAFPYLKEVSEFWLHRLETDGQGNLVAPDGWSPEHGPREDGVSYDQQLVWELFENTLSAGAELGAKDPVLAKIAVAQKRLAGPRIGRFGQLQEWLADRDDPEDHHRHTSHLVGVYPGHQITLANSPDWARAAEVSLRARSDTGDSRRSWTWPWRCALWARLGKSDGHRMIDGYIAHNLLPNLIATHPPFQLDGSFGMTAGICEMLVQSHAREVHLLPAVDFSVWPSGSFRGLRARGGFVVSARWEAGLLVEAELTSEAGLPLELRTSRRIVGIKDDGVATIAFSSPEQGKVRFATEPGKRYRLSFE